MVCSLSVVLGCHGGIVRHFQLRPLLKHRDLFVQICAACCHRMGDARGASCLTWHVLTRFDLLIFCNIACCVNRMGDARGASCVLDMFWLSFCNDRCDVQRKYFLVLAPFSLLSVWTEQIQFSQRSKIWVPFLGTMKLTQIFCAALCRPCCFLEILLHFLRQWNY